MNNENRTDKDREMWLKLGGAAEDAIVARLIADGPMPRGELVAAVEELAELYLSDADLDRLLLGMVAQGRIAFRDDERGARADFVAVSDEDSGWVLMRVSPSDARNILASATRAEVVELTVGDIVAEEIGRWDAQHEPVAVEALQALDDRLAQVNGQWLSSRKRGR